MAPGSRRSAAQIRRRASGWSTSSPHVAARSMAGRRSSPEGGSSGGLGTRSSSARMIAFEPETSAPSGNTTPGTVARPKRRRWGSRLSSGR